MNEREAPFLEAPRKLRLAPTPFTGEETFRGAAVLGEVEGPLSAVLWTTLRGVLLWAEAGPAERPELFLPGAHEERLAALDSLRAAAPLRGELRVLASVGAAEADPARVAAACRAVADWAAGDGKPHTAHAFLAAAALVLPDDADAAYLAGRMARRAAEYVDAERWFCEAVVRARRAGDPASEALARIGMGNLHVQRGNFPLARREVLRALELARRHQLSALQGMASHDLFAMELHLGMNREAVAHAADALRAYGPGHPRLVSLAHDLAVLWMDQGHFARALAVFRAVLPHVGERRERLLTVGSIARAAGAVGDAAALDEAWECIWRETGGAAEGDAQALLALAEGAQRMGDLERARRAAGRALQAATERREAQVQFLAEELLGELRDGDRITSENPWTDVAPDESAEALTEAVVAALEGSARPW